MMLFIIQENALISSVYSQFLNDKHKTFNSSQSEHCLLHMSALCQKRTSTLDKKSSLVLINIQESASKMLQNGRRNAFRNKVYGSPR